MVIIPHKRSISGQQKAYMDPLAFPGWQMAVNWFESAPLFLDC